MSQLNENWQKVQFLTLYVTIEWKMTISIHVNAKCHNWMEIDQMYTS